MRKVCVNMLFGKSVLLERIEPHPNLEVDGFIEGLSEDLLEEYRERKLDLVYGKDPLFVAAQYVQISGPVE